MGETKYTVRESDAASADNRLHVPNAPFRPGDEPRFFRFRERPEDLFRPDPLAAWHETRDHAFGLIRVLDDDGHAAGQWQPFLGADTLRKALETMVRIRAFDSRMLTMQRQGKISFYLESKGEEAVGVGAGMAFRPDDVLFPYYRQQGLMLVRGASIVEMICQCLGNAHDHTKGRQMPVHYSFRRGNIASISSPVATQLPQAVGAAMAFAYRGVDGIAGGWIGDGSTAEGDFHYAVNFAGVYKAPVVLTIVNNQWAISTHCNFASASKSLAARGLGYNVASLRADGNDLLAVYAVTEWAAERARRGGGPTLIELVTYRAGAHSSSDDPSRYRPSDEARVWPGGDPVRRLAEHLIGAGEWSENRQVELQQRADEEVTAAYKQAESFGTLSAGPHPPRASLFEDVYAEMPPHLKSQRRELGLPDA